MTDEQDFSGAKLALFGRGCVLTLLRDDKPDIPFPNMWDLPGGGRDPGETPEQTVLRELEEELALKLAADALLWKRAYRADHDQDRTIWFFSGVLSRAAEPLIRLGDEGQKWAIMPIPVFLNRDDAVPHLRRQVSDAIAEWPGPVDALRA